MRRKDKIGSVTIPYMYTPDELAKSLRIEVRELKKMRKEGRGPKPLYISSHVVRYSSIAVEEYLNAMGVGQDYRWNPDLYCRKRVWGDPRDSVPDGSGLPEGPEPMEALEARTS